MKPDVRNLLQHGTHPKMYTVHCYCLPSVSEEQVIELVGRLVVVSCFHTHCVVENSGVPDRQVGKGPFPTVTL